MNVSALFAFFFLLIEVTKKESNWQWKVKIFSLIVFAIPVLLGLFDFLYSKQGKWKRFKSSIMKMLQGETLYRKRQASLKAEGKSIYCNWFQNDPVFCTHDFSWTISENTVRSYGSDCKNLNSYYAIPKKLLRTNLTPSLYKGVFGSIGIGRYSLINYKVKEILIERLTFMGFNQMDIKNVEIENEDENTIYLNMVLTNTGYCANKITYEDSNIYIEAENTNSDLLSNGWRIQNEERNGQNIRNSLLISESEYLVKTTIRMDNSDIYHGKDIILSGDQIGKMSVLFQIINTERKCCCLRSEGDHCYSLNQFIDFIKERKEIKSEIFIHQKTPIRDFLNSHFGGLLRILTIGSFGKDKGKGDYIENSPIDRFDMMILSKFGYEAGVRLLNLCYRYGYISKQKIAQCESSFKICNSNWQSKRLVSDINYIRGMYNYPSLYRSDNSVKPTAFCKKMVKNPERSILNRLDSLGINKEQFKNGVEIKHYVSFKKLLELEGEIKKDYPKTANIFKKINEVQLISKEKRKDKEGYYQGRIKIGDIEVGGELIPNYKVIDENTINNLYMEAKASPVFEEGRVHFYSSDKILNSIENCSRKWVEIAKELSSKLEIKTGVKSENLFTIDKTKIIHKLKKTSKGENTTHETNNEGEGKDQELEYWGKESIVKFGENIKKIQDKKKEFRENNFSLKQKIKKSKNIFKSSLRNKNSNNKEEMEKEEELTIDTIKANNQFSEESNKSFVSANYWSPLIYISQSDILGNTMGTMNPDNCEIEKDLFEIKEASDLITRGTRILNTIEQVKASQKRNSELKIEPKKGRKSKNNNEGSNNFNINMNQKNNSKNAKDIKIINKSLNFFDSFKRKKEIKKTYQVLKSFNNDNEISFKSNFIDKKKVEEKRIKEEKKKIENKKIEEMIEAGKRKLEEIERKKREDLKEKMRLEEEEKENERIKNEENRKKLELIMLEKEKQNLLIREERSKRKKEKEKSKLELKRESEKSGVKGLTDDSETFYFNDDDILFK